MATDETRLPGEFLATLAAGAEPGSAAARMAAEQARGVADGQQGGPLLAALLAKPYRDSAPAWLLEAAVANGLRQSESEYEYLAGSTSLVVLALIHPDCDPVLRADALRRCSDRLLGSLGTADRPADLCAAVADELRRRVPKPPHMAPELLKEPTPAQVVLRAERLHDAVFEAAVSLLPDDLDHTQLDGEDSDAWSKRIRKAFDAWGHMWSAVLERHPDRHPQLIAMTTGTSASRVVRDQLLGGVPWTVEPALLRQLALDDLSRFDAAMLTVRICAFLQDGSSKEQARQRFATELAALDETERRDIEFLYLRDGFEARWGTSSAVSWVRHAADGRWRLILNPTEAKPAHGDPHTWRSQPDELADLGRHFAETAVQALRTWKPKDLYGISTASDLRWVRDMLVHLPELTPAVEATVRLVIRDARRGRSGPQSYDYKSQEDRRQFDELLDAITRIVADPAPQPPATRRTALGNPEDVTVRNLSAVTAEVLDAYLDRHAGDDALVEKALLSVAWHGHRSDPPFASVLARHSDPQHAVRTLTRDLRLRLGGNPTNRETWAREVLALPDCPDEIVLALPSWTALKARGHRYNSTHPRVIALVEAALGDDRQAWQRFADSPIGNTGPSAWLRLGDILTAAADGTAWPKPPGSR
ncbi:hypothetical protein [Streptomyces sp. NRRL WC-3742]|uniref:hypothetical protein n=1 Tax=Streptomyces sp. NRRL WC-3742 TaxID=1463934 RepID=UPI0004C7FDE0|nr:hypothetical protein [Streptomyces sp. NRRL WC-3742]